MVRAQVTTIDRYLKVYDCLDPLATIASPEILEKLHLIDESAALWLCSTSKWRNHAG